MVEEANEHASKWVEKHNAFFICIYANLQRRTGKITLLLWLEKAPVKDDLQCFVFVMQDTTFSLAKSK